MVTGFCDVKQRPVHRRRTRLFVYGTSTAPVIAAGKLSNGGGANVDRLRAVRHRAEQVGDDADRHLADQRRPGQAQPGPGDRAAGHLRLGPAAAQQPWNAKLQIIEVEGASRGPADHALLEPVPAVPLPELRLREHRHRGRAGVQARRAVLADDRRRSTPTADRRADRRTARCTSTTASGTPTARRGRRTRCSTPKIAGELVDGFVQQYKDGGWIARWSSPGYADLMVGTSSDVAFADAYLQGRAGHSTWRRRTRRRSRTPRSRRRPRTSAARGWTPRRSSATRRPRVTAGDSLVDGRLHQRLRHRQHGRRRWPRRPPGRPSAGRSTRSKLRVLPQPGPELRARVRPGGGLLPGPGRGPAPGGSRRTQYDPRVWGYDYTETNAWNMAFHVPQDGHGLANAVRRPGGPGEEAGRRSSPPRRRRTLPGPLRRHHPRDARGPRRPDGRVRPQQPAVAPHPVHVRLRRPAVEDAGSRSARRSAGSTWAARSARATPATRTTARCPPGRSSARSASTRCRSARRTT